MPLTNNTDIHYFQNILCWDHLKNYIHNISTRASLQQYPAAHYYINIWSIGILGTCVILTWFHHLQTFYKLTQKHWLLQLFKTVQLPSTWNSSCFPEKHYTTLNTFHYPEASTAPKTHMKFIYRPTAHLSQNISGTAESESELGPHFLTNSTQRRVFQLVVSWLWPVLDWRSMNCPPALPGTFSEHYLLTTCQFVFVGAPWTP